jgi:hypothetical protein
MHRKPTIGVLVVTHNQFELTAGFVDRFLKMFGNDPRLYLLVLDNNSSDGTYERIRRIYPHVDIRKLNDNYGCVTGRNIGIVELWRLGCEYIYISDNDIVIEDETFFEKLLNLHRENTEADGSCPVVRWADDRSIQTLGSKRLFGAITRNLTAVNGLQRVDILPGCAQFVKMSAFERFGLYDNDFTPISIEDYEWGIRASRLGAKLFNNPYVQVMHLHDRKSPESTEKVSHYLTGRIVYLRKYFSLLRTIEELRFFLSNVRNYGFSTMLKAYSRGVRKKLREGNYFFSVFANGGTAKYYYPTPQEST